MNSRKLKTKGKLAMISLSIEGGRKKPKNGRFYTVIQLLGRLSTARKLCLKRVH